MGTIQKDYFRTYQDADGQKTKGSIVVVIFKDFV